MLRQPGELKDLVGGSSLWQKILGVFLLQRHWTRTSSSHVLTLALLGVFGTDLPIVLYMNVLRLTGPPLGSMNGYLIPIWTIALGGACLGEVPTPR